MLDEHLRHLKDNFLSSEVETCAVLTGPIAYVGKTRFLCRQISFPSYDAYSRRNETSAELTPEFVAAVASEARRRNEFVCLAHSHPFSEHPSFSAIDDFGEARLLDFLNRRIPGRDHLSLVVGKKTVKCRLLGSNNAVDVYSAGADLRRISTLSDSSDDDDVFDRQVRALGRSGQQQLRHTCVSVVGLGGTGSVVVEQLAHLGVRNFLLIDHDILEASNLSRVVGTSADDVGRHKVEIAKDLVLRINPTSNVQAFRSNVVDDPVAKLLLQSDFMFCCTDSHGSRVVMNQLAYQYYLPCIDLGVAIRAENEKITHITGRVQMLSPGLSCLVCGNLLDPDTVRRDLMSDIHLKQDPYFIGAREPEPAVISINSTVVSLGITMFMSAITGAPSRARYQLYNGISGTVRAVQSDPVRTCVACSSYGALGKGDNWKLPTRVFQ
jgi:molybdopterin-synthase adenylyltransferase